MDRRVTRAFEWLSGIFASLLVIVIVWAGSLLVEVKQDIAILKLQNAPVIVRMDRLESRFELLDDRSRASEARITSIETRNLRATMGR